ncbi:hypothetical protein E2C01_090330 [Portunus trituberculatus]|uniref:Uncharacterized protein n=1 Tax=Portunus trituberculatus TaxID=210409 RepID=A0A5B7JRY1_PORTR|nr:hypothetical protein [Portunus trituberculatus]
MEDRCGVATPLHYLLFPSSSSSSSSSSSYSSLLQTRTKFTLKTTNQFSQCLPLTPSSSPGRERDSGPQLPGPVCLSRCGASHRAVGTCRPDLHDAEDCECDQPRLRLLGLHYQVRERERDSESESERENKG